MRKYNPEIHTPRTGWDAISLEMAREEGKELFVDENGEVWTADKKHFAGKIRKEEPNAELRKAIEETLRELNDAGFANKSILIMSASIRLERALEKVTEDES